MPLFYKPVQAMLPAKDGKKKWHLTLVKTGKIVSTQELSEEASYSTTLTPADMHASVRALFRVMQRELLNSNSVRLDGLGTFTMIARTAGNGVDSPGKVGPQQISSLRVHFTPEYRRPGGTGVTRAFMQGVEFIAAGRINPAITPDSGREGAGDDGDGDSDFIDPTA